MAHFYPGLDLRYYDQIDPWILASLMEHMGTIQAEEQLRAINAATAPHTKRSAFRSIVRNLQRIINRSKPIERQEYIVIEDNADKRAKWIQDQGIKLIPKGE